MRDAAVTLVVPCYNEAARLDSTPWARWVAEVPGRSLLFVDDGSTDATWEVLSRLQEQAPAMHAMRLPQNCGKAEAVRRGVCAALDRENDYIGYWDADLATPLDEVARMVSYLDEHPEVALLLASRVALLGRNIRRHAARHYLGRVFATAASLTLGLPVYDTQCGAKLFRPLPGVRAAFSTPFDVDWIFDVQLISRVQRAIGAPGIHEFPLQNWEDVPGSKVRPVHYLRAARELAIIARDHRRAHP